MFLSIHLSIGVFWATICKTVRPMLSVRFLSVCPVSDVRALWPNGWTDQDETWQAGKPRPWPHCVRWGPSSPLKGHTPSQFSAHICCGHMAAWVKMPLGTEVGLGSGDIVLRKGTEQAPVFGPLCSGMVVLVHISNCRAHCSLHWLFTLRK